MKTDFIAVDVSAPEALREPVLAMMAEIGFDTFEDSETGLTGYITETDFDQQALEETLSVFPPENIAIQIRKIPSQNWNAVWESNYHTVRIDDFCQIVPTFREEEPGFEHTVRIDPKMSFGTGHHETTRLMIRQMRRISFQGKKVLDMGCGTGILGIFAAILGAAEVLGIDIDVWSSENATENMKLNHIHNMQVLQGDVTNIPETDYDIILANINRNVLLEDVPAYCSRLKPGGTLVLSGFYTKDEPVMREMYENSGLNLSYREEDNDWLSLALVSHQN